MKKIHSKFRILMALLCLSSSAFAQDYIVVHGNNMEPRFHKVENYDHLDIVNVFNHPQTLDGDTVYLPGATFNFGAAVNLTKSLVIIGTGIHPDSSVVAGSSLTVFDATNTNYNLYLLSGSDNSELHGLSFPGFIGIYFGTNAATGNVDGVKFIRCNAEVTLRSSTSNTTFIQSIVDVTNSTASNTQVTNCMVIGFSGGTQSTEISNCIIFDVPMTSGTNNVQYRSNIITRSLSTTYTVNLGAYFYNNLWIMNTGGNLLFGANVLSNQNSILSNNISQVFTSPPITNALTAYSFQADYSLNQSSPFYDQYSTHALDGGEVGIYGGMFPWKDGILPFAPHWLELTVPGNATQNGLTGITIKGSAQND